jgi:hypothetical protein
MTVSGLRALSPPRLPLPLPLPQLPVKALVPSYSKQPYPYSPLRLYSINTKVGQVHICSTQALYGFVRAKAFPFEWVVGSRTASVRIFLQVILNSRMFQFIQVSQRVFKRRKDIGSVSRAVFQGRMGSRSKFSELFKAWRKSL